MPLDPRLRALTDLAVPESREYSGLHEYDGTVQDLSREGVRAALERLGGEPYDDPHDEAHVRAFEAATRFWYADVEWHRRNPLLHIDNLDLAGYDRDYAPAAERAAARLRHLQRWPDAVDMALGSLDRVPAPVAAGLLTAARGLAAAVRPDDGTVGDAALAAQARLVAHLEGIAAHGPQEVALGGAVLTAGLSAMEAVDVDLGQLGHEADAERDRLRAMLDDACHDLAPGRPVEDLVVELLADHPDADGVLEEARTQTAEAIEFTQERQLAPYVDGECLVGPAPESRRWSMAMMSAAAPEEPDAPSWYYVTPPDPSWPAAEQEQWLAVFSRTTLPAITVHEVAPGHFAHARAIRHAPTPARRVLASPAFVEGWAHHVEEVCVEEGFRAGDPRFRIGVALEALVRVTRLACAIGLHTGVMTVDDAAARFGTDAFLQGPAALSEARRGTFDPTYGRYTWGKLMIRALREQAREVWGSGYSLQRFHAALLELGSPPLGLMRTALERG